MKVRIYENYKKDINGNTTCTERIIDNIESIDFDSDNDIFIDYKNGESEVIELKDIRFISDIVIVMDK